MRIGSQLRELRLAAGLTQADLARSVELERPQVSAIEVGRRETTSEVIERWATICGAEIIIRRPGVDPTAAIVTAARALTPSDLALLLRIAAALPGVDPTVKEAHARAMELTSAGVVYIHGGSLYG